MLSDATEITSAVITEIILLLAVSCSTGIISYFVGIKKANKKTCERLTKVESDVTMIKKILIIKAKLIDEQTKQAHPEAATELEEIVKEMLDE